MKARRTPVWLVTGYLGSGKTTLLAAWLREAPLANSALIVNEIGEVGLDDHLLAQAVDSASLLANACLCCTGMQGLQEALQELWWDRLYRRRPAFGAVVIETTGLADPAPVLEAFRTVAFLCERYRLAGVVTTVAATAGAQVLACHAEARAQVAHADMLVVTKTDQADAAPVRAALRALNPHAPVSDSAQASLRWTDLVALLPGGASEPAHWPAGTVDGDPVHSPHEEPQQAHPHGHAAHQTPEHDHHHHGAYASFVPLEQALSQPALQLRIDTLRTPQLLRLKGVVAVRGAGLQTLQWSLGDAAASLSPYRGPATPLGLTCIHAEEPAS